MVDVPGAVVGVMMVIRDTLKKILHDCSNLRNPPPERRNYLAKSKCYSGLGQAEVPAVHG